MGEFRSSAPDAELLGGMLYSLWTAFPESFQDRLKKMLSAHGIENVVPDQWYNLQKVLNTLKEIEENFGHHLLFNVGRQAAIRAPVPPEIKTLKQCLSVINATFAKFHRGGQVGGYAVREEQTPEGFTRFMVEASTPYPCSLTRGYLEGYGHRFKTPEINDVLLRHDETLPCRRTGGKTCTYIITVC